jgi:small subunit ribosomal protein S20
VWSSQVHLGIGDATVEMAPGWTARAPRVGDGVHRAGQRTGPVGRIVPARRAWTPHRPAGSLSVLCLRDCPATLGHPAAAPAVPPESNQREHPVANIKSQIKRNRTNEKRRVRNKAVRSEVKSRVKAAEASVDATPEERAEALRVAQKSLGKAAKKGVIHKNQAARRQSRLTKRVRSGATDA